MESNKKILWSKKTYQSQFIVTKEKASSLCKIKANPVHELSKMNISITPDDSKETPALIEIEGQSVKDHKSNTPFLKLS